MSTRILLLALFLEGCGGSEFTGGVGTPETDGAQTVADGGVTVSEDAGGGAGGDTHAPPDDAGVYTGGTSGAGGSGSAGAHTGVAGGGAGGAQPAGGAPGTGGERPGAGGEPVGGDAGGAAGGGSGGSPGTGGAPSCEALDCVAMNPQTGCCKTPCAGGVGCATCGVFTAHTFCSPALTCTTSYSCD